MKDGRERRREMKKEKEEEEKTEEKILMLTSNRSEAKYTKKKCHLEELS